MARPEYPRAGIVVAWIPPTNTKPARYSVQIRDFPNRIYSVDRFNESGNTRDCTILAAQARLDELGLNWDISGWAHVPTIGDVFTTN